MSNITDLEALKRLFEFTDDDLTANRAGRLSARQHSQIQTNLEAACVNAAAAVSGLPALAILIILWVILMSSLSDQLGSIIDPVALGAILGIVIMLRLWWEAARRLIGLAVQRSPAWRVWLYRRMQRALVGYTPVTTRAIEQGRVEAACGQLHFQSDGEQEHVYLDGKQFTVKGKDAGADQRLWQLQPGARYTIYFIPDARWIVAVEPQDVPSYAAGQQHKTFSDPTE